MDKEELAKLRLVVALLLCLVNKTDVPDSYKLADEFIEKFEEDSHE